MIYFIECAGRIKIGYAKDVSDRLKGLSTGAAHDLSLLCSFDGSVHFERAIHAHLKHLRQRGEWFTDCNEVRELMTALRDGGPSVIGFSEPPSRQKPTHVAGSYDPHESPLKPAFERIGACTDRYLGEAISEALKQETALGLPKGTLANRRTGGFYTTERAHVAFVWADDTAKTIEGLLDMFRGSIFDDANPMALEDIIPAATRAAEKYERGLQSLFAPSDPAILDLSGYSG